MRGFSTEQLICAVEAMEKGGIKLVEVTFDQTGAVSDESTAENIRALKERFEGMNSKPAVLFVAIAGILLGLSFIFLKTKTHLFRVRRRFRIRENLKNMRCGGIIERYISKTDLLMKYTPIPKHKRSKI